MSIGELGSAASIAEFLEKTRQVRTLWPQRESPDRRGAEEKLWFRGQRSSKWGLAPKLYRRPFKDADENEVRLEFQSQAIQLVAGRGPAGKWDWYFLMQHHNVPTRLLDWTENSLVALFFAVEELGDCDAAVWALDPWWLSKKLRLGITGPLLPEYKESDKWLKDIERAFSTSDVTTQGLPAPIEPPHVDRRVAAQSSKFLVFGTTQDLAKAKIVRSKKGARLAKITIPARSRATIKKELDDCGINYSLVFPDLEGLAKHIIWRWTK